MSSLPRGYFGISEVLAQLRAEFPDISVSKIRFLETEGLISPARSPAGYRRFTAADVDRLRRILTAQRDQYLPLRVIKERLSQLDEQPAAAASQSRPSSQSGPGGQAGPGGQGGQGGQWGHGAFAPALARPDGSLLTRRELVDEAGLSDALLTELETFGLLPKAGRHYRADAVEVARTAVALAAYGVEARHLPAVRAAAEREVTMIESLVAPIQRQRGPGARELASRTAGDISGLVLRLHTALVQASLAEAGLAVALQLARAPGVPGAGVLAGADGLAAPAGVAQQHTDSAARQQAHRREARGASA